MVKFSLEEYLKDPSRKVVTRCGEEVKIKCTDMDGANGLVIVGLVRSYRTGKEVPMSWTKEGQYNPLKGESSFYDLFFEDSKEPVVRRGWVNVYKSPGGEIILGGVRKSKEEAEQIGQRDSIDTIEISWKE